MVSVLIPVYGESIDAELASLAFEIKSLPYPVEVIVCDDASPEPKPPHFIEYSSLNFKFIQLKENIGRSRIRNYLADQAQYEQLIFIDADCQPILRNFIHNYQTKFEPDTILVGGQLFASEPPSHPREMLRWNYGTQVEARPLKDRLKEPYKSFMANNFSISKSLLKKYPFDINHTGYGHEDTLFGVLLRKNKLKVVHIQNPIRHLGNESNEKFLAKTEEGARNLAKLYSEGKLDSNVRLISTYEKLKLAGFSSFTRAVISKRQESYYKALMKGNAKLRKFSLYKLGAFMMELNRLQEESNSN